MTAEFDNRGVMDRFHREGNVRLRENRIVGIPSYNIVAHFGLAFSAEKICS